MTIHAGSFKRFEDIPDVGAAAIVFQIDGADVKAKSFEPFLDFWRVERIAANGKLPLMRGQINFSVGGFAHDDRAVFEIPETRVFLRELADKWPYFFYADSCQTGFLYDLTNCLLDHIQIRTDDKRKDHYRAMVARNELGDVWQKLFAGLEHVCKLDKQMTDEIYRLRADKVSTHLMAHYFPNKT